jgi:hypothetical protein
VAVAANFINALETIAHPLSPNIISQSNPHTAPQGSSIPR